MSHNINIRVQNHHRIQVQAQLKQGHTDEHITHEFSKDLKTAEETSSMRSFRLSGALRDIKSVDQVPAFNVQHM